MSVTATLDPATEEALNPRLRLLRQADAVKHAKRVSLPRLAYWNYEACTEHARTGPKVDCEYRRCGGDFFDHQTVAIAWSYLIEKGMIASVTGAGKTNMVFGLLALLKERGELDRAVVVCQTPAVRQWADEAERFIPNLRVEVSHGGLDRQQRAARYAGHWDVLVIGYHLLLKDHLLLERVEPGVVITDDVDPLLNHTNETHRVVVRLAMRADRVLVLNATNLQTHLQQLHAALVPIGGHEVFGSLRAFERRYVRQAPVTFWNKRSGRKMTRLTTVGYRNMAEFKQRLRPFVLRHTYEDMTDVRMPEIAPPENVWLDLHPEQRRKYEDLQAGVVKLITEQGEENVKQATALTKFNYGAQICAGLPALRLPDGAQASTKLDWLMRQLDNDWLDTKVVVFMKNVGLVQAFQARLDAAQVGHATVWGQHQDAAQRQREIDRFWQDDNCRVMVGTTAMERSLNLQVSNVLVCVDTHLNPARMTQLLGRVRRAGSQHSRVYVFNLLTRDTQEERYQYVLRTRQALVDFVWDEESALFERLPPMQLLRLISP